MNHQFHAFLKKKMRARIVIEALGDCGFGPWRNEEIKFVKYGDREEVLV